MMTDAMEKRFDAVLDGVKDFSLFKNVPDDLCMCPKHNPWPRPTVNDHWRNRFRTARWSAWTAMQALGLRSIPDDENDRMDTNELEGYADATGIWLRKDISAPIRTAAHELAHQVLGHTTDKAWSERVNKVLGVTDDTDPKTPIDVSKVDRHDMVEISIMKLAREIEAEMTSLLVVDALGYPDGKEKTLATVVNYFRNQGFAQFPRRTKVKAAARKVLEAGGYHALAAAA